LVLDRDNRTLASSHRSYRRNDFHPQNARSLIEKLLDDVADKAQSSGSWLQRELEDAKVKLPALKEQLGKPFAQADELARKRERLKEVIKILADATKAAEQAATAGAQTSEPPAADGDANGNGIAEPAIVGTPIEQSLAQAAE
jgi:phage shock protein A